ncbi:helix-turn-helix domain-containing protein [Bradyrhizobium ottawaense]|uniref:helix-turn-helix domain-containing protein n=2 Tax=Bradyrhizobium ottawaense TaxID=931866 RepID=UPI00289B8575|nr:helix-turn-helix transcriptional regulator [Bradyrhizobium ottawaense]
MYRTVVAETFIRCPVAAATELGPSNLSIFGIIHLRDQIDRRRFPGPAVMQKSLRSAQHARLIELLVAARQQAGVRQHALAKKLGRPQSFIAKYEGGERRIDVVEFVAIAQALGVDRLKLFRDFLSASGSAPKQPMR